MKQKLKITIQPIFKPSFNEWINYIYKETKQLKLKNNEKNNNDKYNSI